MTKSIEISRDIAASPESAYTAISDVTRRGQWSEECYACEWHEGFDGPVVGATFDAAGAHREQGPAGRDGSVDEVGALARSPSPERRD